MDEKTVSLFVGVLKMLGVAFIGMWGLIKVVKEITKSKLDIAKEKSTGEEAFKKLKDHVGTNTERINGIEDRCNKRIDGISERIDKTIENFIITQNKK